MHPQSPIPNPQSFFDAIIIGGGLAGLAAAVELASRGAKVALIERSPRLGGRCYSYKDDKTGDIVDNGQHVLVGAYHNTLKYLEMIGSRSHLREQLKLRLSFHHPEKGFASLEIPNLPKPLHLTAGMLKFKLLSLNDRRKLLNVGLALQTAEGVMERELSRMSVEQWLRSLDQSSEAMERLWFPIAVSVMNELPQRASALLFARALRETFLGTKDDSRMLIPTVGQTELYVDGALKYLTERKCEVLTNAEVASVEMHGSMVSGLRLKGGSVIKSANVISAVPYFALERLLPASMAGRNEFAGVPKFRSSPIVSLHLWFDKEFMEQDHLGLIGKNLQWIFNRRKILEEEGKRTSYLSAVISGAHEQVRYSKERLTSLAERELREVFPVARRATLVHSVVIREKRATFSPTNEVEQFRPSGKTSLDHFYLAGDWTATGMPATIEGAVMSGFRTAAMIS